ncbi:V-set and immunoglobulin domain-containing protein 4 isoform X1 [Hyperolius riggenbachi]|uniref:V-set and immunoglobulin domain-containing protein 4 isoform X1 n=1 Tax=Hyperolius riggenbachi TaxID=752182 RepID=UPI0035A349A0
MEEQVTIKHVKWLFVLVVVFKNAYCDPSLIMEHRVAGVVKESKTIPCKYTPMEEYEEVEVQWFHGNDIVIRQVESQTDIPLLQFRNRVHLTKLHPGDVSLNIENLDVSDKGDFKCKVVWKQNSGNLITKEDITMLQVLRKKPPPDVTSAKPHMTTSQAETEKDKGAGEQPGTKKTEQPVTGIIEKTRISDASDVSAVVWTKTVHRFDASSTTINPYTDELMHSNPTPSHSRGSGTFLYVLIISLACVISVSILTMVLIARRKKKKAYNYNLPTMNQLAQRIEGSSCAGIAGPSYVASESRATNNYQLPLSVSEYQSLPAHTDSDYEQLIIRKTEEI